MKQRNLKGKKRVEIQKNKQTDNEKEKAYSLKKLYLAGGAA